MGIWFHSLNCLLNITQLLLITFLISCTSNFTPTRVKRPNKWWNHFWAMTIVTHTECNQPQDVDIKTIESVVTKWCQWCSFEFRMLFTSWIHHFSFLLHTNYYTLLSESISFPITFWPLFTFITDGFIPYHRVAIIERRMVR